MHKNKILLLSIVLILLIIIIGIDVGKRIGDVLEQKAKINSYEDIGASLSKLQKEYEELKKPILPKTELSNFADDLKAMAKKSDAELNIINNEAYFEDFTISVTATYANLLKFLDNLSKSRYAIQSESFDIQREGQKFITTIHGRLSSQ